MNVIKVYGGLGNQMFQYAFGKAMERNNIEVGFDLSWFTKPSEIPRPYGLDKFRTRVNKSSIRINASQIKETGETYYHFLADYLYKTNTSFFGYWQNLKYVERVLPILRNEFRVNRVYHTEEYNKLKAKIITTPNSVGIHIRRGDYLTKGHHLLPLNYYKEAISQLKVIGHIFVFSDDIEWCKTHFPGSEITFIDIADYLSLELLRTCQHKIIANSTFSWWAAILGQRDGQIFAPIKWRLDDKEEGAVITEGLIPETWIRI